jgi:Zn-dependent protease/predicted transcriptional regulator
VESQIKLGRIFGIDIGLHYSWFIIALLITLSLGTHFGANHPEWPTSVVWASAVITGFLFFASLLVHELSHALTARARHLPVGAITLFALGGVSRVERESEDPESEFLIGIVGPVTSVLVGFACLAVGVATGWSPGAEPGQPLHAVLVWLGYINFVLAAFNMIPGFPLDGGRVLRAIVWAVTHDARKALRVATRGGQIVAFLFIVWGLLQFFASSNIGGLWIMLIGWFLMSAATATYVRSEAMDLLRDVPASALMTRECPVVEPSTSVDDFVFGHLLRTGRRCFLVADGDRIAGLVTLGDLKSVPRAEWDRTPLARVMRPIAEVRTVSPEAPASEVFETMTAKDVHQVPVVDHGVVRGVVSRGDLMRVLQAKAELGV